MARLTGRNTGFSWFVGLFCLAVVAVLVVMAAPMGPVVADWTRATVTTIASQASGAASEPHAEPQLAAELEGLPETCAALSSPALSEALQAAGAEAPAEGTDAAPEGAVGIAELVSAQPVLDCVWAAERGSARVWIATVPGDAGHTAEELLRAGGFECHSDGGAVRCTREHAEEGGAAASTQSHVIRDGLWAVTATTGWDAAQFAGAIEQTVWPAAE